MKNPEQKQPYRSRKHRFEVLSRHCDIDVYITSERPVTIEEASKLLTLTFDELSQCEVGQENE